MLRTRNIFTRREPKDGLRASVVSRHTKANGYTPDTRIHFDLIDEWWPWLGPPDELIVAYIRKQIDWPTYEERYIDYLWTERSEEVDTLVRLALSQNVTILCFEREPRHCHRRLLSEFCRALELELPVNIR